MRRLSAPVAIIATLFIALAFTVVPLPNWALALRPLWVALTVYYWAVALPERFGVGYAWIIGLFLDALTGSLFGAHALALTLVAFVAARTHLKLRMYPLWQQSLTVGFALGLYAFVLFWISGLTHQMPRPLVRFAPVGISILLWPWIYGFLRVVRRRYVHT